MLQILHWKLRLPVTCQGNEKAGGFTANAGVMSYHNYVLFFKCIFTASAPVIPKSCVSLGCALRCDHLNIINLCFLLFSLYIHRLTTFKRLNVSMSCVAPLM